ncbi:hypothetical protein [Streptomyces sp. NPDC001037]|uniref:hypothetical protein n=1 Tax=Streptomyces sp. NPDC001037 TaxID=3364542 RepID=UPI00368549C1
MFATAMSRGVRLARDQAGAGGEPEVPAPDGMAVVRGPEVASALEEADVRAPAETLRPVGAVLRRVHRNGRRGESDPGELVSRAGSVCRCNAANVPGFG